MRIKNLEFRNIEGQTPTIILWWENHYYKREKEYIKVDKDYYSPPERPYHHIHKSCFKNPETCMTIASFRKDSDGYYLEFIGDRPLDTKVDWQDFRTLVQVGYAELNNTKEE